MPRHAVALEPDGNCAVAESITAEQAQKLAMALGSSVDPLALRDQINDRATIYRWLLHVDDVKRPKRTRDDLSQLSKDVGALIATIDGLESRTRQEIRGTLEQMLGRLGAANEGIGSTRDRLTVIMEAAERTLRELRPDRKPSLDTLRYLCDQLATFYEEHTGLRFTFAVHRESGKRGKREWLSPGAEWVADVAAIVDPDVTEPNLVTVLREIRKAPSK